MKNELFISLLFAVVGIGLANKATAEISVADCEAQIVANKDLQILKGKIDLLNTANQPIEILANSKVPSNKEKAAIALWVEEQKRCSAPGIEYHKSQSPEVGAIYEQAYSELFISAADLYQRKITYGDFARATVRRHQEVRERIAAVIARFREQQQRQQAEKEQREAWERQQADNQQREALAQQRQLQIQQQQDYQRQEYQRQRENQQFCETRYQQCLNRARDIYARNSCQMENAGCGIGNLLNR